MPDSILDGNGLGFLAEVNSSKALKVAPLGFNIPDFDEIVLSYTGTQLTGVIYKKLSVIVATLTLSYTGTNLTGVVKT